MIYFNPNVHSGISTFANLTTKEEVELGAWFILFSILISWLNLCAAKCDLYNDYSIERTPAWAAG
jgi:hypothetical protein